MAIPSNQPRFYGLRAIHRPKIERHGSFLSNVIRNTRGAAHPASSRKPGVMAATLGSLPEELLGIIFTQLGLCGIGGLGPGDIRSLAAVSRVSRQFHRIVEPIMYQRVCGFAPDMVEGPRSDSKTPRGVVKWFHRGHHTQSPPDGSLLRTLRDRPDLARLVKSLSFVPCAPMVYEYRFCSHSKILDIVALTDGLEDFDMSRILFSSLYPIVEKLFRDGGQSYWSNLRTVGIGVAHLDIVDVVPVFQLPRIQTVHIVMATMEAVLRDPTPFCSFQSTVRTLTIAQAETFHRFTLEPSLFAHRVMLLTKMCPALESFSWVAATPTVHSRDAAEYLTGAVSSIRCALPTGPLQRLEIFNNYTSDTVDFDRRRDVQPLNNWNGVVSFSGVAVKSLKVDMLALFRENDPETVTLDVIPTTLQQLTLRLTVQENVFVWGRDEAVKKADGRKTIKRCCELALRCLWREMDQYRELKDISLELCRWLEILDLKYYCGLFSDLGVRVKVRFLE